MENRNEIRSSEFPIKAIVVGGIAYGIYQVVNTVVAAIFALLMGLVYVAVGAAGILTLFFVYRYITDKQYGETKNLQQIEKLERDRKLHVSRLPKHLRDQADEYYKERQRAYYDLKTYSRADAFLERIKQVLHTFRQKDKNK
jgi:uncharacterized membrane protein YuzA (DUF378 family)